ncbi:MAG: phosphate acyltransferase PlsX [Firmicutes bacterium]|jgi:glycerol-3-phosphate acyltransferase PlsX|nr:phosphate acyltransferase PlsX [Bacillota bacterium]
MVTIALDAMGGDYAPSEIVRGALEACHQDRSLEVILVGDEKRIKRDIRKPLPNLSILHTDEVVEMHESPSQALKKKKKASIILAANLVKNGEAQAVLSAGNTGAILETSVLTLGRLKGIRRPAIATSWPTHKGVALLLDSGANANNKPEHLVQFALMGSVFVEKIRGITSPAIGLLNIGEEPNKGPSEIQEAFQMLQKSKLNFIGNVETTGFLAGEVDVAVCDGFVGNMVLKTAEAVSEFLFDVIKKELRRRFHTKVLSGFLKPTFRSIGKRIDYIEYGAAPFLGVNGICLKSHGKSKAKAIKNAIFTADQMVKIKILEEMSTLVEEVKVE